MIVLNCEQRSEDWYRARLGIPTASCFDKLITPTGKLSTQAEGYANLLIAEQVTGKIYDEFLSEWVERGAALEPEARAFYEMETGLTVQEVGLILRDDRRVGCSPDGLAGEGLLEIKCPAPHTHIGYLLSEELPAAYRPQVQGQLLVTGKPWVDFLSYHPDMPPALIRVERDEAYIGKLAEALDNLLTLLDAKRGRLAGHGIAFALEATGAN